MAEEKKEPVSEQGTQELTNAVRDYQNGDAEAFNIIYELSYRYLYVCIRNIIGSEDESRDILQNTYMDIAKSISSLNQAEAFLSWAGVIARRECYAYFKKIKILCRLTRTMKFLGIWKRTRSSYRKMSCRIRRSSGLL